MILEQNSTLSVVMGIMLAILGPLMYFLHKERIWAMKKHGQPVPDWLALIFSAIISVVGIVLVIKNLFY